MSEGLRTCNRCVMDTSDPDIRFRDDGTCNHCNDFLTQRSRFAPGPDLDQRLGDMVAEMKHHGKGKQYDCVVGVSGGVDSTYVAYVAKELGLRPLAVHLDNGWNSELAVHNIEHTLKVLEIDLHTVVLEWETFRELQKSFLRASVTDAEIPTDHAIRAALWHVAAKYGIKYLLNGRNHSTEGILPWSWTYNALDWKYIQGVHRKFSRRSLREYPHTTLPEILYRATVTRFKNFGILDYVPYDKKIAMQVLIDKLGWRDYGGKHYESIYTRFFQGYILPTKFGIDKRKAHLSVLVCTGQVSRDQAMATLREPPLPADMAREDREFVEQKLELTRDEFEQILNAPPRTWREYPNNSWIFLMHDNPAMLRVARGARALGLLPRGFGDNMLARKPDGASGQTSH
jgi:N-acetyl sugar amidotransferase